MLTQSSKPKPDKLSVRVVNAVAEARDVDPLDLSTPIGTVLDSDALDSLGQTAQETHLKLSFEYAGCEITIQGDTEIAVEVLDGRSRRSPGNQN